MLKRLRPGVAFPHGARDAEQVEELVDLGVGPVARGFEPLAEALPAQLQPGAAVRGLAELEHGAVGLLLEQIVSPVRWKDIIVNMEKIFGVSKFIEIGPSNVLSGLIKRIDKNADVMSVNSVSTVKELESLRI